MDLSQYISVFLDESEEHLQSLNQNLLELEKEPRKETIDEIFRSAHTLKGMAATMGFDSIAKLTHQMENVLSKIRSDEITINGDIVDILFKCLDTLESMVSAVASGSEEQPEIDALMSSLQSIEKGEFSGASVSAEPAAKSESVQESAPAVEKTETSAEASTAAADEAAPPAIRLELNQYEESIVREARKRGYEALHITVSLQEGCLLKQARAFMVFSNLEDMGDIVKSEPDVQDIEQENFGLNIGVVLLTQEVPQKVEKVLMAISEVEKVEVELIELSASALDLPPTEEPAKKVSTSAPAAASPAAAKQKAQPAAQPVQQVKANQTVRVDIERLDTLMNLVGELVISKTRLDQIGRSHTLRDLAETSEHIDRISGELQAVVMKVRMVPVEQVFNRFPRMVRDLSKELNKEINFVIEGQETELDRTVIDEIGDPIVHLLRNSIDHGVESPEERVAVGKPRTGNIFLRARHEGNNVVIEIEDDGQGVNPYKLRDSAISKGLITEQEAELMSESELINLIMMPGFSTAQKVTGVSGRGVGMDAVKSKIEGLSGSIRIETETGKYTRISIWLPLTLAIIQALLVRLDNEIYAIPLANIEETISIEQSAIKYVQNKEITVLRENTLPLLRLHEILNVVSKKEEGTVHNIVVVRKGEKRAGFIVDDLIGQQEIVIKSLGKLLTGISGIAGATILGSGEVALILDVDALI